MVFRLLHSFGGSDWVRCAGAVDKFSAHAQHSVQEPQRAAGLLTQAAPSTDECRKHDFELKVVILKSSFSPREVHSEAVSGSNYFLIKSLFLLNLCCLLSTSDAADEEDSLDLGARRIIKKKQHHITQQVPM